MKAVIVFTLVAIATTFGFPKEWEIWKKDFNKTYVTEGEELHRYAVWEANKKYVSEHNSKPAGFLLGMNKFADLEPKEFSMMYKGYRPGKPEESKARPVYFTETDLPAAVDWRTKGYVTPVKDQGQCGSCWAFSTVGTLEGQHFNATGTLVSLSEQNLVDCSGKEGNLGCAGGWPHWAMEYVIANKGIDTEASYPYLARDQKCKYNPSNIGSNCVAFNAILPAESEASLQAAMATVGPISVCIDASQSSFQLYSSGVYDEPNCSQTNLDHCVLAVGYDKSSSGDDYWIVKNSWGTSWGQAGYIWMTRNKDNQCGIATNASYPTVTA